MSLLGSVSAARATLACSSLVYAGRSLEEALVGVAALGFEYADLAAVPGWAHVEPSALAGTARARGRVASAALGAGVRIVALNAGLGGTGEESVASCRALAETALELGVRVVTLQPPPATMGFSDALALLGPIAEVGCGVGVAISLEIHRGGITELPADAARLAAATGLGLTLDPSHIVAGSASGRGLDLVLPYVDHVHVRDAGPDPGLLQLPMGRGAVDFESLFGSLSARGYEGVLSIEYIGRSGEPPVDEDVREAARVTAAIWPGRLNGAESFARR